MRRLSFGRVFRFIGTDVSRTIQGELFRDDRLRYFGDRVWDEKLGSPKEDLEVGIKVFLDGKPRSRKEQRQFVISDHCKFIRKQRKQISMLEYRTSVSIILYAVLEINAGKMLVECFANAKKRRRCVRPISGNAPCHHNPYIKSCPPLSNCTQWTARCLQCPHPKYHHTHSTYRQPRTYSSSSVCKQNY